MAKWEIPDDEPFIKPATLEDYFRPNEFFNTPKSREELMTYINKFNGSERTAAMVSAMMTWNLACSIVSAYIAQKDWRTMR